MARLAQGHEHLETAIKSAATATTIAELRMAQALLMPLQFGLSLDDTSVALGISKSWVVRLRKRFRCLESGTEQPKTKKGMRNRARMSLAEEAALLAPFIEQARLGGVVIVPPLKVRLEERLGRTIGQTTVYTLLHRHGWRKLAPDKQHPKSDPVAQDSFKKNYPNTLPKPKKPSRRPPR